MGCPKRRALALISTPPGRRSGSRRSQFQELQRPCRERRKKRRGPSRGPLEQAWRELVVCQEEVPAGEEGISGGGAAAGPSKESRPRYGGRHVPVGSLRPPSS